MNAVLAKQAGSMIVIGGPGSGKTLLLRHFRAETERNGMLAAYARVEKGENLQEVVRKAYLGIAQPGEEPPWSRTRKTARETEKPDSVEKLIAAAKTAGRKHFGAIIFLDDIDRMRKAEEGFSLITKLAREIGMNEQVGFVVSSTRELMAEGTTAINLKPFELHEAKELVEKALKKGPPRMGEECLNSIMADSKGNPRIIKTVCWYIYDALKENEKVISKGHYLANLPSIMGMLSRDWFDRLYQETPAAEREILAALSKSEDGMHVSDVAKKLGKKLGPTTALIGRLLESGQIVKPDRGRYRIFARIYARYVGQRS